MPAKITVIVYILICLEVGILLILLPWSPYWDDNFFLYFITGKLHADWLAEFLLSGYVRGAVTALGVLNVLAGLWEAYKFKDSVRRFSSWEGNRSENSRKSTQEASDLSDHRQASVSRTSEH